MGWANCGTDSKDRPIGYAHEATCDHPGCAEKIDRGLAYACGGMHGEDEISCEGYFCEAHLLHGVLQPWAGGRIVSVCEACFKEALEAGYDEEEDKWPEEGA